MSNTPAKKIEACSLCGFDVNIEDFMDAMGISHEYFICMNEKCPRHMLLAYSCVLKQEGK